jgi:hypothetical protein
MLACNCENFIVVLGSTGVTEMFSPCRTWVCSGNQKKQKRTITRRAYYIHRIKTSIIGHKKDGTHLGRLIKTKTESLEIEIDTTTCKSEPKTIVYVCTILHVVVPR